MTELAFDENKLKEIYLKVVEEPNKCSCRKDCIKCPECGEEILMIPTLRVMNQAIENHIHRHKEVLRETPIKEHQVAITIRLALVCQVLQQAAK